MGGVIKLSIGLPVNNGEKYISYAIDSILNQTFADFELIICDNASVDKTQEICLSYNDKRIRYHRNEKNMGAAWNYNRTEELAKGKYFKWAAHDDVLAPDFLRQCVEALDQNGDSVLVYTKVRKIDENGCFLRYRSPSLNTSSNSTWIRFKNLVLVKHPCTMFFGLIRREALKNTSRHGNYNSADRVLLAHLALKGRMIEIPEPLFYWRWHAGQSIRLMKDRYAYALWFDPLNAGKKVYPKKRLLHEYYNLLEIEREMLGSRDRFLCHLIRLICKVKYSPVIFRELVKGGVG